MDPRIKMSDAPVVLNFPIRRPRILGDLAEPSFWEKDDESFRPPSAVGGAIDTHGPQEPINVSFDANGRIIHVDPCYYKVTGEEPNSASRSKWFPALDPRDAPAVEAGWRTAVHAHDAYMADFRLLGSDDGARWYRAHCIPLPDFQGRPQGWFGVCVGIDDLKEEHALLKANELGMRRGMAKQHVAGLRWRDLQTGLADAARLSAIGQLATSLAHEINQPLTAASTYAKAAVRALAKSGPSGSKVATQAANDSIEQILRAGEIVRNLCEFVLNNEGRRTRESFRTVIEEAAAYALIGVQDLRVSVRITLDETMQVRVNRIQIQQVLINLIRNALEAMETMERRELDLTLHEEAGKAAVVCVADSGPGLGPEFDARLFYPCVSAKPNGMGVGLSICRTIVESHGGRIWAEPGRDGGAVFKFSLPMIDDEQSDHA